MRPCSPLFAPLDVHGIQSVPTWLRQTASCPESLGQKAQPIVDLAAFVDKSFKCERRTRKKNPSSRPKTDSTNSFETGQGQFSHDQTTIRLAQPQDTLLKPADNRLRALPVKQVIAHVCDDGGCSLRFRSRRKGLPETTLRQTRQTAPKNRRSRAKRTSVASCHNQIDGRLSSPPNKFRNVDQPASYVARTKNHHTFVGRLCCAGFDLTRAGHRVHRVRHSRRQNCRPAHRRRRNVAAFDNSRTRESQT